MSRPRTLRELKAAGYRHRSVKDELRDNMIARLRARGEARIDGRENRALLVQDEAG